MNISDNNGIVGVGLKWDLNTKSIKSPSFDETERSEERLHRRSNSLKCHDSFDQDTHGLNPSEMRPGE